MSAALGLCVSLQSEVRLWFAIEAEYRPEGSWKSYNLASRLGSGWMSAVTITQSW